MRTCSTVTIALHHPKHGNRIYDRGSVATDRMTASSSTDRMTHWG